MTWARRIEVSGSRIGLSGPTAQRRWSLTPALSGARCSGRRRREELRLPGEDRVGGWSCCPRVRTGGSGAWPKELGCRSSLRPRWCGAWSVTTATGRNQSDGRSRRLRRGSDLRNGLAPGRFGPLLTPPQLRPALDPAAPGPSQADIAGRYHLWESLRFQGIARNRSTLPQVVGWLGREFFWTMPRRWSSTSKLLRPRVPRWLPPDRRVVKTMPLSVSVEAGIPCVATAVRNLASTIGPVTWWWAVTVRAYRQWSSSQFRISVSAPGRRSGAGEPVVGEVGLPALVELVCGEADGGRLRFFFGSGVTSPAVTSCRAMVARETVRLWWCSSCQPMVSGPASRPVSVSFCRISMIRSTVWVGVACGVVFGRRERARRWPRPRPGSGRGVRARPPRAGDGRRPVRRCQDIARATPDSARASVRPVSARGSGRAGQTASYRDRGCGDRELNPRPASSPGPRHAPGSLGRCRTCAGPLGGSGSAGVFQQVNECELARRLRDRWAGFPARVEV